jgi:integrase
MFSRKRAGGKVVHYATAMNKGRQYNELVGTDKREALRVEARIRREIREETFQPKARRTGAVTAARYAETWGAARTNRTANDDRQRLRDYFELHFGTKIRMYEIAQPEAVAFVRWLGELARAGKIKPRTARHIRGVVRTMFRDAKLEGVIASDPFSELPRKLLPKPARHEREVYSRQEAGALLEDERVPAPVRVLLAMMLYMGVREGEACGRHWRDWDPNVKSLGSMNVVTQYNDEPLKTDQPRKVPVHPALAECLERWWNEGFELTYCRKPVLDDFIIPNGHPRSRGRGAHTKSSAYKAMARACTAVGVRFEGCHLTRHTMITHARRGGALADVLERVTHNARGSIIDQYTHFDWKPLCDAVLCIDYTQVVPALAVVPSPQPAPALAPAMSVAETQTAAKLAAVHVASHVGPAEAGQKHEKFQWRRRELKTAQVSRQGASFIEFCGLVCREGDSFLGARRRISSPRLGEQPDHYG